MLATERRYAYRPKWTTILFGTIFFGVGAAVLFSKAKGNDRGLIIDGLITLSPDSAVVFYQVLGGLSVVFVAMCGFLLVLRLKLQQSILLTDRGLSVPRSRWSSAVTFVPFSDIVSCTRSSVSGQRFLVIDYGSGKFRLAASMLPGKADFDAISDEIARHTGL